MDDGSVEALREVLQDMSNTVDLLSSGAKSGDALILFLEDVLRTIEAWAAKYNIGLEETAAAMEYPRPFYQDTEAARNDVNHQVCEETRTVVAYHDFSENASNAVNPEAREVLHYSDPYLNAKESRNCMELFQASEEVRKSTEYPKTYPHSDEVRNTMLYAKDYVDTEAGNNIVYPTSKNAMQYSKPYFQHSEGARSDMEYAEGEMRNSSSCNQPHVIPNSYGSTYAVLKNDHHNHSRLSYHTTLTVNGPQMMDQLELALDLDHDVHVNVSELVDLTDQRIMHSNGGNGSGSSFSWEVHNRKEEIREDGLAETEQTLSFHENRMDCTNQSSQMLVAKNSDTFIQGQCHLTSVVVSRNPSIQNLSFKCDNNLIFTSPSHMPKNLKLDLVTQYNVMAQPKPYDGKRDVLHSSDWADKHDETEGCHSVMDSNSR